MGLRRLRFWLGFFLRFFGLHGGKHNTPNLNISLVLFQILGIANKIVKDPVLMGKFIAKGVSHNFFPVFNADEHGLSEQLVVLFAFRDLNCYSLVNGDQSSGVLKGYFFPLEGS